MEDANAFHSRMFLEISLEFWEDISSIHARENDHLRKREGCRKVIHPLHNRKINQVINYVLLLLLELRIVFYLTTSNRTAS